MPLLMNAVIRKPERVSEIQGFYGPFQVLENRIQQIWALQLCQPGPWRTIGGRRLLVVEPGKWNRGSGPDFQEAVLEIDGKRLLGDVELHLYREDWWRHGHHLDPSFSDVILHVVLFAGGMDRQVDCRGRACPEEWIMGPWLREDIEAVSGGDPGLFGELCPELKDWLEADGPEPARARLRIGADRRWQDKCAMARCLLAEFGWQESLHRTALFHLGMPYNRRAFYDLAVSYAAEQWRDQSLPQYIRRQSVPVIQWNLGRPANRPMLRLEQYQRLFSASPDWMERLQMPPGPLDALSRVGDMPRHFGARAIRKALSLRQWMDWLDEAVHRNSLHAGLRDRLWVDVYLPFLSAATVIEPNRAAFLWFDSRAATFPDAYRELLAAVDIIDGRDRLLTNGLIQGLFWAEDQLRLERVRSSLA